MQLKGCETLKAPVYKGCSAVRLCDQNWQSGHVCRWPLWNSKTVGFQVSNTVRLSNSKLLATL